MTRSITLTPKIMEVGTGPIVEEPSLGGSLAREKLLLEGTDADLPRLLAEADFVVVAVPLLPATRGMIGVKDGGLPIECMLFLFKSSVYIELFMSHFMGSAIGARSQINYFDLTFKQLG